MLCKPLAVALAATLAIMPAAGCTKSSDQSSQTSTTQTAGPRPLGDVAHGKQIFTANCAACHGATGTEGGGIGPSLKAEKARKNFAATVAWIHDPKPPMPKLWPSPLGDKDVQDVAAYVQSL